MSQHYPGNQGPHYWVPPVPPKRRKVWPWVVGGVLVLMVLGFASCAAMIGAAGQAIEDAEAPVTYRYQVTGDGKATVTYQTDSGMSQAGDVSLPFERDETFTGVLDLPNVTGTVGTGGGSITCRVLDPASGKVLAENTASGQFASCSASPQPK